MFLNSTKSKKGFTLIELLVVVAIIGILASVILVNLSRTRLKGKDASLQSSMSSARVAAELFFSEGGFTYDGMCDEGDGDVAGLDGLIDGIIKVSAVPGASVSEVCNASVNTFIIEAPLNAPSGDVNTFYCVDHTGYAGVSNGSFDPDSGCQQG